MKEKVIIEFEFSIKLTYVFFKAIRNILFLTFTLKKIMIKTFKTIFILLILFAFSSFIYASGEGSLSHDMVILIFQISIILAASRLTGSIFEKIKMPRVLGEIIAGILIGPYLLGGVSLPGFEKGLFPLNDNFPVSNELYGLTTIASVVLLFLVGLETDIETFLAYSIAGSCVGIGGVIFSFVLGDFITVLCSKVIFNISLSYFDPIPMFMGVISTATSVGISARILSEKKKMNSPEGVTILSGAVIDDVLGIILLAIILGIIKSGHIEWKNVAYIAFKAVAIWLGFTFIGLKYSRQLSDMLKKLHNKTIIAVMSLSITFLLAGIFEKSGLAMIIGAYIMGLSLSKTDLSFVIQENLSVLYNFFVPIFFCVMGMLVNLHGLLYGKVIIFGICYVIFAVLAKVIGCGLPSLFLNFNLRGALRIGVGMTPRGEVGMIIAGIGLSHGIIQHDYFGIAIMMTFITTLVTPPIFSKMLESEKPILKKATNSKGEHEEIIYDMPNQETAELILSKVLYSFENEGFFIHRLNIPNTIYQIRKNQSFFLLRYSNQKLTFECQNKDVAFLHTLFYEVIAEFERIIRKIQALTYKDKIGKKIFSSVSESKLNGKEDLKVKINAEFSMNSVNASLEADTKQGIISELLEVLISSGKLDKNSKENALKDVMERENIISTGMQDGIALPHARTDSVKHLVFAMGINKKGVDFDSLDKMPAKIFFLILSPKNSAEPQLQFLASISKILQHKDNRGKLLSCPNNHCLYQTLISLVEFE